MRCPFVPPSQQDSPSHVKCEGLFACMAAHPRASASKRHVLSGVVFRGRSFFKNQAPCLSIPPAAERKSRKRPAPPPGGRRRGSVVCPFRFLAPPARGNGQRRQRSQNPQGQKTGNKTLKTGSVLHDSPNQAGQCLQDKKHFPGQPLADAENPYQQQRSDQQHRAPLPFLKRTATARSLYVHDTAMFLCGAPGRQPQMVETMFSQASEGLVRKASAYAVRLFYHADGGGVKAARRRPASQRRRAVHRMRGYPSSADNSFQNAPPKPRRSTPSEARIGYSAIFSPSSVTVIWPITCPS